MDFEAAKRERDRRLRNSILRLCGVMLPQQLAMTGGILRDQINGTTPPSEQFEDDQHVMHLLKDLEAAGYLTLKDLRTRRAQRYEPSVVECELTSKGRRFLTEDEPADSMIDDGRIVKGQ
jgi:hypothetical protein